MITIEQASSQQHAKDLADLYRSVANQGTILELDMPLFNVERLSEFISDFRNAYIACIAYVDGIPAGFAIGENTGDALYCHYVYVAPNFRGRQLGIALEMKQIEIARTLGLQKFETFVDPTNTHSHVVQSKIPGITATQTPKGTIYTALLY